MKRAISSVRLNLFQQLPSVRHHYVQICETTQDADQKAFRMELLSKWQLTTKNLWLQNRQELLNSRARSTYWWRRWIRYLKSCINNYFITINNKCHWKVCWIVFITLDREVSISNNRHVRTALEYKCDSQFVDFRLLFGVYYYNYKYTVFQETRLLFNQKDYVKP